MNIYRGNVNGPGVETGLGPSDFASRPGAYFLIITIIILFVLFFISNAIVNLESEKKNRTRYDINYVRSESYEIEFRPLYRPTAIV